MAAKKLDYTATESEGHSTIYTLSGRLYGSTEGYAFQETVRQRVAAGANRIVIDLSGVESIDSSGVGILVTVMWSASRAGGHLVLASLSEHVRQVLGLALLLDHIDHAESVGEALGKLEA